MSVLDGILDGVREDLRDRMAEVDVQYLCGRADARVDRLTPNETVAALRGDGVRVIAEVKRSSPALGSLAAITDPAALATQYAAGGAAAVSVLTEARRFSGSLDDLAAVRAEVAVPLLRKDFVVHPYQVIEAAAYGADLLLLIVAALSQEDLELLMLEADHAGLAVLVEAHTEVEVVRAVDAGARVIGINARDLTTLEVHRETFARLVGHVPAGVVTVAESGIRDGDDVRAYVEAGADAVLVGSALVRSDNPATAVSDLVSAGRREGTR
ncbi:indole-3-glycerol phosphate synthase TrpC [Actinokineospora sp. NBRC 105648]|uniref:indole-3-glycerol phosphate synthase TrpC n=1 Tax=Actinokineospora sp. NBRC 105648 TaxID=3032206 RepID=UPI0024A42C5C|nr:indole-3-glycerol phosphate synthase TrpC [Actinokineospora sp. NBRC 105648]GLZ42522.1 indole-3-glycerol phosphate synthase 1 [Actinokineospora sp. NBRC 105648]